MRTAIIKSSWIPAAPHMRLDARFWVSVVETMQKLGIDPQAATIEDVKRCIAHNDAEKARLIAEAGAKRDSANALIAEARELEHQAEIIRPK